MTTQQYLDLAAQFRAMADSVEQKRKTDSSIDLKFLDQRLLNEASALEASAIMTTLDAMEPHYDAMLSVIRDLKAELNKQAKIDRIANFADKALSIALAFRTGNVSGLISSIDDSINLVKSVRT